MRVFASLGVFMCLGLTACSGLVRNFVNTQPRVALDQSAFSDPDTIVKGDAVAYEPESPSPGADIDTDLATFAPVIVQGVERTTTGPRHYDPNDDALGAPHLTADGQDIRIDTSEPRIYARVEHATVGHTDLEQLVYAFWYPSHPVGSIESGEIDGGVLRVTLDAAGQPAVFEYTQPCGCFHGVFVSDALEAGALAKFKEVAPHREYAVEPPLTGHDDWVVRGVVKVVPGGRITLYVSAGKHACEAIRDEPPGASLSVPTHRAYALESYASLDHVAKDGGGRGSIFDDNGLVLGAKRGREQLVLGDLDHAGWPRRLDKMLIHWDADHWTDPTLLETHLRLPGSITDAGGASLACNDDAMSMPGTAFPQRSDSAPTTMAEHSKGRRLVLFTNGHCLGCQQTKKYMAESGRVHAAMRGWQCQVVDTLTREGALLAAQARITSVPVLVGYEDGHEIFRADDIDSPEKIASVLAEHSGDAKSHGSLSAVQ